MIIERRINCKDHQSFADYLSKRLSTELPIVPKMNGTNIYLDNIRLSIELSYGGFFVVVTDNNGTKLLLADNLYTYTDKKIDKYIQEYTDPQFVTKINPSLTKSDSSKEFSTRIAADVDSLLAHIEKAFKIAESKPEQVLNYNKDGINIIMRFIRYRHQNFFVTLIKKDDSNYVDLNVLGVTYDDESEIWWKFISFDKKFNTTEKITEILSKYPSV